VGGWEPHLGRIGLPTDCTELRSRAKKLAELLQQATRAELNECPATHVKADTERALHEAAGMAARCFQSHPRLRRFFTSSTPRSPSDVQKPFHGVLAMLSRCSELHSTPRRRSSLVPHLPH